MTSERKPPAGVPADAVWNGGENEWEFGTRDSKGRYHGEVRYWRPDGTLCNACNFVDGVPHGESKRFHENGEVSQACTYSRGQLHGTRTWFASDAPTTEKMLNPKQSKSIRRIELDYRNGLFHAMRCYDRDGNRVNDDGTACRPPAGVPEDAHWSGKIWITGVWNEQGKKHGAFTEWTAEGILIGRYSTKEDKLEGTFTQYDQKGRPLSQKDYVGNELEGPAIAFFEDGSKRSELHYRAGKLEGKAEVWRRDGSLARRATLREGSYAGPLQDFDATGKMVREVNYAAKPAAAAAPAKDDALARAIAEGWGGDEDRDAEHARAQRRRVWEIAPESVRARLRTLELDRAPRIWTADRLTRVLEELGRDAAIDAHALRDAFARAGGAGTNAGFGAGGALALQLLQQRITKSSLGLARSALAQVPREVALLPSLTRIDLANNQLRTVPAEIADVLLLHELDLKGNRIEALPSELRNASELSRLFLGGNDFEQLPAGLCELEQLETLDLSGNQLRGLPEEVSGLARLDTLWLHDNPLESLPRSMAQLRNLTFLHLGDIEWAEPPPCVFEIQSLETLWLASHHLRRLSPTVAQLRNLRMLSIWYSALEELPEELFEMKHLRELRVKNNPLPDSVYKRLAEALPNCTIY
jgi:antitoxin component YwqK of YwqJK toxin-antitoxin module